MASVAEIPRTYFAPRIELPVSPRLEILRGYETPIHPYIEPDIFLPHIRLFCQKFPFHLFDVLAYNAKGGEYPAELITHFAHLKVNPFPIEYHPDGRVVTAIPARLREARVLVAEDIYDTGKSLALMRRDCPGVQMITMSIKEGVENQGDATGVTSVFRTVNKWQGGAGMNLEFGTEDPYYPVDAFRKYPGIVIRPSDDILEQFPKIK